MTRAKLSAHFSVEEFDCHDGTRVPTNFHGELRRWCMVWGEPLRSKFGPVEVLSGFRTRRYNASIGGAGASYHVYGTYNVGSGVAVDVRPRDGRPADWAAWAQARRQKSGLWLRRNGRGGVGLYPTQGFVHLDTGPRRDWRG